MSKLDPSAIPYVPKSRGSDSLQAREKSEDTDPTQGPDVWKFTDSEYVASRSVMEYAFPYWMHMGHRSNVYGAKWEYFTLSHYLLAEKLVDTKSQAHELGNAILGHFQTIKFDDEMKEAFCLAPYVLYEVLGNSKNSKSVDFDLEAFSKIHQVSVFTYRLDDVQYKVKINLYAMLLDKQTGEQLVNGKYRKIKELWHKGGMKIKKKFQVQGKEIVVGRYQIMKWTMRWNL